jgi:hypothetical protein
LYFAYGSNLSQEDLDDWKKGDPKHAHVDLKLKKVAIGYLPGYRLGFTRKSKSERRQFMGVADIVPSVESMSRVWGVIFLLTVEQDKAIEAKEGAPTSYRSILVKIIDVEGKSHDCMTYQAVVPDNKRRSLYFRPSQEYYEVIRKGGEDHELPREFFYHLKMVSEAS